MRRLPFTLIVVLIALIIAPSALAAERDQAVSLRLGIPTDVLMNMSTSSSLDMYVYGLGVEAAYGIQMNNWLILGGIAGGGYGRGEVTVTPNLRRYAWVAPRIGFGRLAGFSGSLIAGVVFILDGELPVIPDIGVSLDWRFLSVAVSTGSVSVGGTLRF